MGLLGEVSIGEDESQEVVNAYTELNWSTADEVWMLYLSNLSFFKRVGPGWDEASTLIAGLQFSTAASWYFSAQYQQEISTFAARDRNGILSAQVRYRH